MSERLEEIMRARRGKAEQLESLGQPAYPSDCRRTHTTAEVVKAYKNEKFAGPCTVAGRVMSLRGMGGLVFADIFDGSARLQILVRKEKIGEADFTWWNDFVDLGDFVETTGTLFTTKTGEITLAVSGVRMLTKSVRPLPAGHYGLEDEETRLRKRYLDILLHPEVRDIFIKKNIFWQTVREFLAARGFLEVQTPVLEDTTGGADAEPFVTHHNSLDRDFYLRISLELPLKRLLVAGYEKVFEIGRLFRNEGMDRDHLQEYDDTEFYWSYADHEDGMRLVEELYRQIVQNVTGGMVTHYEGKELDWSGPWPRLDYFNLFAEHAGIDLNTATLQELQTKAKNLGLEGVENLGKGRLIDAIYKRTVRPHLIRPSFLVGHPIDISPLSKTDPANPRKVLRMQVLAGGSELGNGWSELNDGAEQRRRFEEQMRLRLAGDKEAQMLDEDFVEALEYGMPPAFGFGMSERLFAILMDKSIRETVIFPAMRKAESANVTGKSKQTKIAVAIINEGADLAPWQKYNTIAHLCAAFGVRAGKPLLLQDEIETSDAAKIKLNIQHAIMIKTARDTARIQALRAEALRQGLKIADFIREMIETTDDRKVLAATRSKSAAEIEYLGLLIFGPKPEVEKLTADLALIT